MRFRKLELKNFKSHVDTTIKFDEGISLIIGENGAGKSSIFEAITFALFTNSKINISDLVRTNKGLKDKIVMEVKLTFDADGNEYRVERKVTKKNGNTASDAQLYEINNDAEAIIAQKVNEVNKTVQQILNMDSETYLNAIHIRQGDISSLIDAKPAERKKVISQLLRIDDLEKAYDGMPDIIGEFELKNGLIKERIVDETGLETELENLNNEQNTVNGKTATFTAKLEELNQDNEVKQSQKTKLDEQKTKLDKLKVKHESEEQQFEILNKNKEDYAKKYEEIIDNEKEMIILKPFCDKLDIYNEFKESYLKFINLKKDEDNVTEILEKIRIYKEVILTEQKNYDRYRELEGELKEINLEKTKIESDIQQISDYESRKETQQKDIEKNTETLNQFYITCMNDLADYTEEDEDFKKKSLNMIEEFVEGLKDNVKTEITQIDEKISEITNKIGGLNQAIKSSKKQLREIEKVDNKCPTCQSHITETKKNQLIDQYKSEISDNNKKINELKQSIDELNHNKTSKDNELTTIETIKNNVTKHKHIPGQIESISEELKTIDEKLVELTGKQEKLNEINKFISEKTKEFENLKSNFDKYTEAQTLLNNQKDEEGLKKQLNEISNKINELEKQLNALIESDSTLSFEIDMNLLNSEIDELTEKNNKYNKLAGTVKDKEEYETKIKQNNEKLKNKENELETIKKTIETCTYDEETHKKSIQELDELNKNIQDLKTNIAVNEERLKTIEIQIQEVTSKIEENRKLIHEYKAIKDYIELLKDFREHYGKNGIQKDLRSQSSPIIQSYTSDFFDKFNFNYSDLQLSDEYEITIVGPEGDINIDMVSGGEKIAIALSLRLAITQAMSKGNIETILLDEPTIHLDSFRKQELITVLRSMKIIPQMIIVTHDSELETAADTLFKIVKEDGISKVVGDD